MSRPLRAAVVGTGVISKEHLAFLANKTKRTHTGPHEVELAAVCDLSRAAADYHASRYGAGRAYTDVAAMLAAEEPDVVHVLTPPSSHGPLSILALESGAHVLCEKPITATSTELRELLTVAEANDRHLMESQNYRFNDEIIAIADAIADGKLGAIREVEIRVALDVTSSDGRFADENMVNPIHQMPAGVIHDFTTHFTYLLLQLSQNASFDTVAALWLNQSGNPLFRFDNLDAILAGTNAEGPVHGRLRFDSDTAPDTFAITVRGTEGYIETDLFQPYLRLVVPRVGTQLSPIANHLVNGVSLAGSAIKNFGSKLLQTSPYHGLHRMLDVTYARLLAGDEPPITPGDMLTASSLVDQLLSADARVTPPADTRSEVGR